MTGVPFSIDCKSAWDAGLHEEIEFWRSVLSGERADFSEEMRGRADPNAPVVSYLAELLPKEATEINILDVAAGPISSCGWKLDGRQVNLTAVDALAEVYNGLLDEFGINPPVRTTVGEAERLSSQFGGGRFDLVHIRNALDHCYDPLLALREMLFVAKPGGTVFVHGFTNEAQAASYQGLHQWNIDVRGGRLVLWNKAGKVFVDDHLSFVKIDTELSSDGRWLKACLRQLRSDDR
jgi:SAM-dependent methyltransferase